MPDPIYHSDFHRAAVEWAEAGFFVFPCIPLGKRPAVTRGCSEATQDLEQISQWWDLTPHANVAVNVGLSGHVVVDVDPPLGTKSLEALEGTHATLPSTFTTRSPRGGLHYWFTGDEKNSTDRLGKNIDTRGQGGYVLVPPSYVVDPDKDIKGAYEYANDVDVAELPAWVSALLKPKDVEASAAQGLPVSYSHLEEVLEYIDPGTDRDTWRDVIAAIRNTNIDMPDLGWDDDPETKKWELAHYWSEGGLHEEYSETVQPQGYTGPDDVDTAWETLPPKQGGVGYGTLFHLARRAGFEGAPPLAPLADIFAVALENLAKEPPAPRKRSRFYPLDWREMDHAPDPVWQIKDLMQEQTINLCLGGPKSYKSFLALDIGLSIATGSDTFGSKTDEGCVFYGALEGRRAIMKERRQSWQLLHDKPEPDNFYVMPGPMIINEAEVQEFGDQIQERLNGRKCKLIILDTVSKAMLGLEENSSMDTGRFVKACESFAEYFKCSVIAIHHLGKDETRGARGSSAFLGNFDSVWTVKADPSTKAVALYVDKQKDGAEPEHPFTFQGKEVGKSLAFFPITNDEHHALTAVEDLYSRKKIGGALKELKAIGAAGVTTEVLASKVAPTTADQTQLQRESAEASTATALKKLAKDKLRDYCEGTGRSLTWALPG